MKQVIDLRPVYHRKEERIRAHVLLCWLALLLARVAENACGQTWPELRRQLDRLTVGTFTGPAGNFRQRTEISPAQQAILDKLGISPPPKDLPAQPCLRRLTSGNTRLDTRLQPGTDAFPHVRPQIRGSACYTAAEPREQERPVCLACVGQRPGV